MQAATIDSANAIPLNVTLGIRLTEIGPRHAVMETTVDERHLNYFGGAHGGLLATLADTVCFFSAPLLPAGRKVTTVNLNVNYVRAVALGEHLVARSELLHLGRRTASVTLQIHSGKHLVAHGTATLAILAEPAGKG
ncbi:MAG TPA: PaaI family thioesterase [Desulfuromonas sp.]|nr:PaaI family thioesterase [Desulfuromonas sp.]